MTAALDRPNIQQSDGVFHLSPFVQLHENTICPVYGIDTMHAAHCNNSNSEGECSSVVPPDDGPEDQSCEVSRFYPAKCAISLITRPLAHCSSPQQYH